MSEGDSDGSKATEPSVRDAQRLSRRNWMQIAGATGVTALAGCSGGNGGGSGGTTTGGSSGKTVVEYWRWPHSTEPSNEGENRIVKLFNEGPGAKKGIEVKQVTNPFGDHRTKVKTAIGSNSAPDIAWTFTEQYYDTAGKDKSTIKEEAPYVYIEEYVNDEWISDFYDKTLNDQRTKFGGVVGAPFISGLEPGLMYLNVDAWKAAGLGEVPSGSWSYQEYLDAVEAMHGTKVNGTTVNGTGIGLKDANTTEWSNYPGAISSTAGSLIGNGYQRKDDKYVLTTASTPEIEAWNNLFGKPINRGQTNNPMAYDFLETQEPFVNGQLGFLYHTTYSRVQFGQEADFEWTIIPFPTKNGNGNYAVYTPGVGSIISMTAFKKAVGGKPKAAAEFIKFRNNARNQYRWFNTSSQTVPNRGSYQMMKNEGVSDFVKKTGGLDIMGRVDEAYGAYADIREAIKKRYPDIKTTEGGAPVTNVPTGVASGRVGNTMGGMLQQLAQSNNKNPKQQYTQAEKEWGNLVARSDSAKFAESSSGFNKPEPKAGPL